LLEFGGKMKVEFQAELLKSDFISQGSRWFLEVLEKFLGIFDVLDSPEKRNFLRLTIFVPKGFEEGILT
jgi:hypothetical protein